MPEVTDRQPAGSQPIMTPVQKISWIILLIFGVWMGIGALVVHFTDDSGGGSYHDRSDYPACSEIAQYPGTWEEALCRDGDDLIEVQDHRSWDHYHPFD